MKPGFFGSSAHALGVLAAFAFGLTAFAQPRPPAPGEPPPFVEATDPRVENRTYHFEPTGETMPYSVFVSSQVSDERPSPVIVTLHGLGVGAGFMLRGRALDLAEEGGYILVGPMGYNEAGWYGSPVITFGDAPVEPENLRELSEQDVMNVLDLILEEFNVDEERVYIMGHSMGGAGALYLGAEHAERFAAIGAIAPAAFRIDPSILAPVSDSMPVIIVHGDADTLVPVDQARRWVDWMAGNGMEHEYHELEGVDHGVVIEEAMPAIYEFFSRHRRPDSATR